MTLLVDKGVTLFASRDPKDYDVNGPGTCGTMPAKGPCKAFITIRREECTAIMGDGVINGRGGAKMLGQDTVVVGTGGEGRDGERGQQGAPYSDPRLIARRARTALRCTGSRCTIRRTSTWECADGRIHGVGRSSEDADS